MLIVMLVVAGCFDDPTTSDAYQSLEADLVAAEQRLVDTEQRLEEAAAARNPLAAEVAAAGAGGFQAGARALVMKSRFRSFSKLHRLSRSCTNTAISLVSSNDSVCGTNQRIAGSIAMASSVAEVGNVVRGATVFRGVSAVGSSPRADQEIGI